MVLCLSRKRHPHQDLPKQICVVWICPSHYQPEFSYALGRRTHQRKSNRYEFSTAASRSWADNSCVQTHPPLCDTIFALDCHMGSDFEFIHFPCRGHRSWSHRYNPDEVLWRIHTPMAICSNYCVLLHSLLSSLSDPVDYSNGYCVRNLVRCWNRINQSFGLVGKWAKARFSGDRRYASYLCWGSGY